MKRLFTLLLAVGFLFNTNVKAQEEEPQFGIKFSGYVKNDFFWDTRQTVAAREGHFLLWPQPVVKDENGDDINAVPNFNFLSLQTRLSGKITGPDAFGAKTSALIEGDFFAQADDNINLFRLRHAMIKMKWENTELITGQYWNPFFTTGCFPATLAFNPGLPFQSFGRNPQIRLTQQMGNLSVMVAALAQRDFSTRGKDGPTSTYLRNSAVPDMHVRLQYNTANEEAGTGFLVGANAAYKTVVPRITNASGNSVDESLSSLAAIAYTKITLRPVTIKLHGRYGENIADLLAISGFGVMNTPGDDQTYTPLLNTTLWGEVHTNGSKFQVGVFGGYMKNLGTKEAMAAEDNPVYGFGTDIYSLLRIAPRAVIISGKAKFGVEVEYNLAEYGDDYDTNYVPATLNEADNLRLLLSIMYAF
ncbi:MAG TPA: hypothetical protein VJ946_05210 [Bacteroidales bacterium]|nr:hypothetical protein [Bacteroidales bacterium]